MIRGRVRELIRTILVQGLTPHKLALTIAFGSVVGIMPVVWGATLLCVLLAYLFRLNQAAIQAVNYLLYPVQIALFLPFYRLGARIFPWGAARSGEMLVKGLQEDFTGEIGHIFVATGKAVAAWLIIAPPAALLLYLLARAFFRGTPGFKCSMQLPRVGRGNINDKGERS